MRAIPNPGRGAYPTRSNVVHSQALPIVLVLVLAGCLLASPATGQDAKTRPFGPPARLELVDANPGPGQIQPASGWQLSALLRIKPGHFLGVGAAYYPPVFPDLDRTAFLVFTDPDHCPSFVAPGGQLLAYESYYCSEPAVEAYPECEPPFWPDDPAWPGIEPCPPTDPVPYQIWVEAVTGSGVAWPRDETWIELTPGISVADFVPAVSPIGFEEEEPTLWVGAAGSWTRWHFGPDLGSTEDEVRYGAWQRLPGLVVLADHGPGVRVTLPGDSDPEPAADYFDRLEPLEAWNLAGFFTSASYSLRGGTAATSVLAHLVVPRALFTPVVAVDKVISNPLVDDHGTLCGEGDALYRMDGGPLTCYPGGLAMLDELLNGTVITVRVFVVDGEAPDLLVDLDSDGDVDIHDAQSSGLTPVTQQVLTRFRQQHEIECGFVFDFDGDGNPGGCVAPARPGGLTQPPR